MRHFIPMVALAAIMVSCGTQKQVANSPKNSPFGAEITLPCMEYSYDDNNYFRALGSAMAVNVQNARTEAFETAKSMLVQRFGGKVKSVSELYTRSISIGNAEDASQILESDMQVTIERMIGDAKKTCEKVTQDDAGNYNVFIAIQVSKKEMAEQVVESAAKDKRLGVEQHRDDFRKIFDKEFENE